MGTNFNCEDTNNYKIRLEKSCTIKNFDPKKSTSSSNQLAYALSKGQTVNKSKLTETQYKILEALASANDLDSDDDIDILTVRDLMHAKNRFKTDTDVLRNLGVKEFRCDVKAGVANITAENGEVLRIEFGLNSKPAESKPAAAPQTSTATPKPASNSQKDSGTVSKSVNKSNTKVRPDARKAIKKEKENITAKVKQQIGKSKRDSIAFLRALGEQETRDRKNPYTCINYAGYVGKYQMGEQALIQMGIYRKKPDKIINGKAYYNNDWKGVFIENKYGITSLWDFRNSPDKQEKLQMDYKKYDWKVIKHYGLTKYVGKKINGQIITESGLLAGAHLVGVGGLIEYFNGNYAKADGSGTPVSRYIKQFAGYNISKIIN